MKSWKDNNLLREYNNLLRESFVLRVGSAIYRPFTGRLDLENHAYASWVHLTRDPMNIPQEIKGLDPKKTWIKSKKTGKICMVGYEKRAPYHPGEPEEPPKIEVYDEGSTPNLYTYEELLQYFEMLDGRPCGYVSSDLA